MASTAASKVVGGFKSPTNVRVRSFDSNGGTPVTIPASPFMKKLGCGTGVNVYLMDRLVVPKLFIERYYTYCGETLKGPLCNFKKEKKKRKKQQHQVAVFEIAASFNVPPTPEPARELRCPTHPKLYILHPSSSLLVYLMMQAVTVKMNPAGLDCPHQASLQYHIFI